MILFHYSVDSYTDAPSLTNDYVGHYKYAEPFLLALERGRAVFEEHPLIEILADGENRVIKAETY